MICVSLGNISFEKAIAIAGISEMVEVRADLLDFSNEQFLALINSGTKIVFTCRAGKLDSIRRKALFQLAVEHEVDFIDLELESVEMDLEWIKKISRDKKTEIILSYHNYDNTPDINELTSILKSCFKLGADVAKIATLVNEDSDLIDLLSVYRKKGRKVVLGMGEKGILTRVAALALGAEFSFASPDEITGTAPGQLSVSEMKELLQIMQI